MNDGSGGGDGGDDASVEEICAALVKSHGVCLCVRI